jgi:hypothetical protein
MRAPYGVADKFYGIEIEKPLSFIKGLTISGKYKKTLLHTVKNDGKTVAKIYMATKSL